MLKDRRFYQVRGWKAVSVGLGALIAVPALTVLGEGGPKGPPIALLVMAVWYVVRLPFAGVHVSPEGLRVVNVFRTHRIPWPDVERFTWGRIGGLMPKVGVELSDGRRIGIFGLPVGGAGLGRSSTAKALDALNRHLADHRSGGKTSGNGRGVPAVG